MECCFFATSVEGPALKSSWSSTTAAPLFSSLGGRNGSLVTSTRLLVVVLFNLGFLYTRRDLTTATHVTVWVLVRFYNGLSLKTNSTRNNVTSFVYEGRRGCG